MPDAITQPVKYIYVDVEGFTVGRSVEAQSDIIAALNAILSESFASEDVAADRLIFFPVGDGVCAAILGSPVDVIHSEHDVHIRVSLKLLSLLEDYNSRTNDATRTFKVRVGVNANVDNIITDINGRRSLAGPGINGAQRVMNAAGANQVFVSPAVYDTLRYREAYMHAFRAVSATAKHNEPLTVYQLLLEGRKGLDTSLPDSMKMEGPRRLPRLLAHYVRIAVQNKEELLDVPDIKGNSIAQDAACILYYMMALDAHAIERASETDSPILKLRPEGDLTLERRLAHYRSQDIWVTDIAVDYIKRVMVRGFESCFTSGDPIYVSAEGLAKLRSDHQDLAKALS
jgi:class 3 adenylate cyclase